MTYLQKAQMSWLAGWLLLLLLLLLLADLLAVKNKTSLI